MVASMFYIPAEAKALSHDSSMATSEHMQHVCGTSCCSYLHPGLTRYSMTTALQRNDHALLKDYVLCLRTSTSNTQRYISIISVYPCRWPTHPTRQWQLVRLPSTYTAHILQRNKRCYIYCRWPTPPTCLWQLVRLPSTLGLRWQSTSGTWATTSP